MVEFDARPLNWRFIVPSEPDGLLLLPADGERLARAVVAEPDRSSLASVLRDGPYPAIAAPDVGAWARLVDGDAVALLSDLASSVEAGGWLFVGLANPWFPAGPRAPGSVGRRTVLGVLRHSGFEDLEAYLAFPDQRCPAYFISSSRQAELNYFLRFLFLPYAGAARGWRARTRQRALLLMRAAALAAPHRARVNLAPAFAIVARRQQ